MNGITKNDLSFDSTKLDFDAMLKTAGIAYAATRRHVERDLNELQHLMRLEDYETGRFSLTAKSLAEEATRMALAADVYQTMLSALNRHEISIINKPVITEESL